MSRLGFELLATAPDTRARAGRFRTLHNEVLTPLFMPVGTQATVRNQRVETLEDSGSQILLANTYHLLLRPGPEVFKKIGGIHKFMNWKKSVLTDSGGYQIFSLPGSREMKEEGARFKSFVDSRLIMLTPELSIEMQKAIGSDIMMVLDQCIPSTSEKELAIEAMNRTHRWAKRSLAARGDSPQSMFGIVQGACYEDLRKISAEQICSLPFDGFAIGGLAVGETREQRQDFTEMTAGLLPAHLPRYLMGVGTPIDLLEAVHRGVDMFDCIIPVAWAQQGVTFTSQGRIELRRGVYSMSEDPIDPDCSCSTCKNYSRAYLGHLIRTSESLGWQLCGVHNLHFYHRLMREMRQAIFDGTFAEYYRAKKPILESRDSLHPSHPTKPKKRKDPPTRLGDYEVVTSEAGHSRIRQLSSGETMHSVSDPIIEATRLYVEQSRIVARLQEPSDQKLVIWDVGLGAAANVMALLFEIERLASEGKTLRPLEIVSFENDLDSLRLALLNHYKFKYLRHPGPATLLEKNEWSSKLAPATWKLLEGDVRDRVAEAAAPDLIFYDPFSAKADSPLWDVEWLTRMREAIGGRECELFTYSASTLVRARFLAAGFFVARGCGTPPKDETTIALSFRNSERELLGVEWLTRWDRSEVRDGDLDQRVRTNPQFTS